MFNGLCHLGNWGMIGNFGAWGWAAMIVQMLFWVGLIIGVVLLIAWAIRRSERAGASAYTAPAGQSVREILQARYARGEITREQYQQMLQDLR